MVETDNSEAGRKCPPARAAKPSRSHSIIDRIRGLVTRKANFVAPPDFTATYNNPVYRFSFKHPPSLNIEHTDRGGTTTIVARNAERTIGFQLNIQPFVGDRAVTPAALARDLPGVKTRDQERVRLSGAGRGLAFYATDRNFGESFQVWFVREGHLYQLSAYAPHAVLVRGVLATWQWT